MVNKFKLLINPTTIVMSTKPKGINLNDDINFVTIRCYVTIRKGSIHC